MCSSPEHHAMKQVLVMLDRLMENYSTKGQTVDILGFAGHMVSAQTILLSPCSRGSSHRQRTHGRAWLGANATLFAKRGSRPDLARGLQSAGSCSRPQKQDLNLECSHQALTGQQKPKMFWASGSGSSEK